MNLNNFEPKDFLEIAISIHNVLLKKDVIRIENKYASAWIRTAISRAYYAAFLFVNHISGYKFIGRDAHQKLINNLLKKGGKYTQIGNKLNTLRKRRNDADYEIECIFTIENLNWILKTTQDILKKACELWLKQI